jgi:N-acyl amino acid synthase of PEP-CTERM/exosortase system
MRLIDRLFGKRDILTHYFDFTRVLRGNIESFILKDIYQLRYQVYCLECGDLQPAESAAGSEIDEYDDCAIHVAAYNMQRDIVGTVRLVQPRAGQAYPFEAHCTVFDDVARPAPEHAGEVSRLVVGKTYRRRRGDTIEGIASDFAQQGTTAGIVPARGKRANGPLLLLGMYREMYRHSRANGVRYWYAAMERSLAHSLDKMGFKFVAIGPQADYDGAVTPYLVDLDELDERLRRENTFLAAWFNDERIPLWILIRALLRSR